MTQTAFNKQSFKNLRFSPSNSNVDVPKTALIAKARKVERRSETEKDEKGNPKKIQDSCAKIILEAIDAQTARVLIENNISIDNIETFNIELEEDESFMIELDVDKLANQEIDLTKAMLAPLWVSKGYSGSYSSLKLVIDKLKFVDEVQK